AADTAAVNRLAASFGTVRKTTMTRSGASSGR
ncbi:MAG: hypothetical protein ACI9CV_002130, partial [Ilumatobacter sp.]